MKKMNKYTDALYPDKINDLVDNDGNVDIKQQSWSPLKIHYTFQEIVDNHDNDDFRLKLEEEIAEICWGRNLNGGWSSVNYIEFSTADNFTFKGLIGFWNVIDDSSGFAFNGEETIDLRWALEINTETGEGAFALYNIIWSE